MGNVINRNYASSADDNGLCYSVSCTASGVNFRLNDGVTITCTRPGARVNAPAPYTGSILCPDPALFCRLFFSKISEIHRFSYFFSFSLKGQPAYQACRNDCSRNGYCNSGVIKTIYETKKKIFINFIYSFCSIEM